MRQLQRLFKGRGRQQLKPLAQIIAGLFKGGAPGAWYDPSDINLNWRYNLLTYTEQFDNAAWSKVGATTPSANLLLLPSVNNYIFQSIPSTFAGRQFTISMELSGSGTVSIGFYDNVSSFQTDTITLTATPTTYSTTKTIGIGAVDVRALVGRIGSATATSVSVNKASLTTAANASLPYQQIVTPEISYLNYQPQPILYQDSAGTTPVTAVEQPVGLMLDKSQGLVLGPELVTNGDFSDGTTGWSVGTDWAISGGFASRGNNASASNLSGGSGVQVGKTYQITWTQGTGTVAVYLGSVSGPLVSNSSAPGTYTYRVLATATGGIVFRGNNTMSSIDNISVRELPGNHAFQSTSASRPVLSARVNQVLSSEALGSSPWSNVVSGTATLTPTNNAATAPNGTNTATKLDFSATADGENCLRRQSITVTSGVSCTRLLWLRSDSPVTLYLRDPDGVFRPVSVGVTWSAFSVSSTTASSSYNFDISPKVSSSGTSSALTVYAWGADLRVANAGVNLPAYQRVNTATDYNTVGFLPYLKFDGVDDSLSTNSINFTSTDKMSVFAGVRKLSDAAAGVLYELSASFGASNGTFYSFAGNQSGAGAAAYAFGSRGTLSASLTSPTTYAAPITNVITGLGDISGDLATLRINGTQAAQSTADQSTADQGTGNYGNHPLYIGRRNNASLPFNGQLYSMIIVGKAVTAGELSSTEKFVASKTGVTL